MKTAICKLCNFHLYLLRNIDQEAFFHLTLFEHKSFKQKIISLFSSLIFNHSNSRSQVDIIQICLLSHSSFICVLSQVERLHRRPTSEIYGSSETHTLSQILHVTLESNCLQRSRCFKVIYKVPKFRQTKISFYLLVVAL